MSERNGTVTPSNPGTKPIVIGDGATGASAPAAVPTPPAEPDPAPGAQPTAPVTVRPKPRLPHRGPLTVMGPWAPVAGGLLGLVLGFVAALFLAGAVETFEDRLALV